MRYVDGGGVGVYIFRFFFSVPNSSDSDLREWKNKKKNRTQVGIYLLVDVFVDQPRVFFGCTRGGVDDSAGLTERTVANEDKSPRDTKPQPFD